MKKASGDGGFFVAFSFIIVNYQLFIIYHYTLHLLRFSKHLQINSIPRLPFVGLAEMLVMP